MMNKKKVYWSPMTKVIRTQSVFLLQYSGNIGAKRTGYGEAESMELETE